MTWRLQGRSRIMRFDEEVLVLQFAEITYVDGKPVKTLLSKNPVKANVQPLTGRELLLVPEHQRFLEQYWLFVPKEHAMSSGQVIERKGINYQVQDPLDWGSYQECRVTRVDVGAHANP